MRENRVKRMWEAGQAALGGWLTVPSSFSAELMAHSGFDWLCVDMQHGVIDYQIAVTMLQAISTTENGTDCARTLERAGDHHEGAGRRRLWGHHPDREHGGRGGSGGVCVPVPAPRHPQPRPDSGGALRRAGLHHAG